MERHFEYTCAKVTMGTDRYNVVCLYRSPSGNLATFTDYLFDLLDEVAHVDQAQIICGDFNVNFLEKTEPTNSVISVFDCFNLIPCVFSPTRVSPTSSTLIDNIFVNNLKDKFVCTSEVCFLSDHHFQMLEIYNSCKPDSIMEYKRCFSDASVLYFQSLLANWTGMSTQSVKTS